MMDYAESDSWAGAAGTARPVAHDERPVMSNTDRTEPGITLRHARGCRYREGRCTCSPTYRVQVWDAAAGKRISKTFPTITAARRWRQDAYAALTGRHAHRRRRRHPRRSRRGLAARRACGDRPQPLRRARTSRRRSAATSRTSAGACCPSSAMSGCGRSRCRSCSGTSTGSPRTASRPPRSPRRSRRCGRSSVEPANWAKCTRTRSRAVGAGGQPSPDPVRHGRADRGDARQARQREGSGAVGDCALRRPAPRRADRAAPRGGRPRRRRHPRRARLGRLRGRDAHRSRSRAGGRCRFPPCCVTGSSST